MIYCPATVRSARSADSRPVLVSSNVTHRPACFTFSLENNCPGGFMKRGSSRTHVTSEEEQEMGPLKSPVFDFF